MFSSLGILEYNPISNKTKNGEFWLILRCDSSILNYYSYWANKQYNVHISKPVWGAHISIVRGEIPNNLHRWWKYNGQKLNFKYSNEIEFHSRYFLIPVFSDKFTLIRTELGLSEKPIAPFHMSLGKI